MLTAGQELALGEAMSFLLDSSAKELLLNGGPGVGKTYLTKEIVTRAINQSKFLQNLMGSSGELNIVLTATTNQAAENLSQKVGMPACTIHSFLGLKVIEDWSTGKTKLQKSKNWTVHYNTLIVIDESSMVDTELLKLIREATINCKVLFILDKNQVLPLFTNTVPVMDSPGKKLYLTEVVRQAAGNSILTLSEELRAAISDGAPFPDIQTIGSNVVKLDGAAFKQKIIDQFTSSTHTSHSARVLAWTNKKVLAYNQFIRSLHYQTEEIQVGEVLVANSAISLNGLIYMATQQEAEVLEAEEPTIERNVLGQWITLNRSTNLRVFRALNQLDALAEIKKASAVKDWPTYFQLKEFFADLRPVHASTVHKAQGSTFDTVFLDLDDICSCNIREDVLRMLYVGVTRPRFMLYVKGKIPDKYLGSTK